VDNVVSVQAQWDDSFVKKTISVGWILLAVASVVPLFAFFVAPFRIAVLISSILGFIWLGATVTYYRRVRTRTAGWLFAFLPLALGVFFYLLLFIPILWGGGAF
jgi:hypothetical protein